VPIMVDLKPGVSLIDRGNIQCHRKHACEFRPTSSG
jgi:hypothetical protein